MLVTNIGVMNYSNTPDAEILTWMRATEQQMAEDVAPIWHLPAPRFNLVRQGDNTAGIDSWIVVANDAHDITQRFGLGWHRLYFNQPIGYVLVDFTKNDRQTPSRVFSHEVLEMAIDPEMNRRTPPIDGIQYLVEAGDVLSFDAGGYLIDDVLVSGFGTPAYFHLESGSVFAFRRNGTTPPEVDGPLPAKAPQAMGTMLCWVQNGQLMTKLLAPTRAREQYREAPMHSRRYRRRLDRTRWDRID